MVPTLLPLHTAVLCTLCAAFLYCLVPVFLTSFWSLSQRVVIPVVFCFQLHPLHCMTQNLPFVPYFSPMSANIKQLLVQKWVSGTFVGLRCSEGYGKLHTREKAHMGQAGEEICRELPESLEVEGGRGKQCSGKRLKVVAWWNCVWPFAVTSKAGSSHFSGFTIVAAIFLLHLGLR